MASRVVWASSQTWWTELQRGELREGDGAREGGVGGEIGGNHVTFMELQVTQCHFYNSLLVRAVTKSTWFPEEGTQTPHLNGREHRPRISMASVTFVRGRIKRGICWCSRLWKIHSTTKGLGLVHIKCC